MSTVPSTISGLPPSRLCPPKNIMPYASIAISPPTVAAMVLMSVSRFFTWASSCAITPSSSSRVSNCNAPSVTATAALRGLRPVAKALGACCGHTYTRGMGSPARWRRSSTMS